MILLFFVAKHCMRKRKARLQKVAAAHELEMQQLAKELAEKQAVAETKKAEEEAERIKAENAARAAAWAQGVGGTAAAVEHPAVKAARLRREKAAAAAKARAANSTFGQYQAKAKAAAATKGGAAEDSVTHMKISKEDHSQGLASHDAFEKQWASSHHGHTYEQDLAESKQAKSAAAIVPAPPPKPADMSVWQACQDDNGYVYYYNKITRQSQWEVPEGFQ
jgi:hypothetical protein